jgi:hypothetical protein
VLHVYAITDGARRPLPRVRGLDEAPLERAVSRRVAAVYTRHESPPEASEDAVWRHENVVEALMTDRAVLPARFGTAFANEQELRPVLRQRETEFVEKLDFVRGRVELGLRVLWSPDERRAPPGDGDRGSEPGVGRSYLAGRLEGLRHARDAADAVHAPLASVAVASRHRLLATARLLLTAAYLVEKDKVDVFNDTLDRVRAAHPALGLLCTGPWPPYNFVDNRPAP